MNICLFSLFSDSICDKLQTAGYLYTSESNYTATSSFTSSNGVSSLTLVLMKYLPTGNYHSIKEFSLSDIMYC